VNEQMLIVFSSAVRALVRTAGMVCENAQRKNRGESMAYVEEDFQKVIVEEGLSWNQVIETLRGV